MKFAYKLTLLICLFVCAFLFFSLYAYLTIEEVKIDGPLYKRIIQGKDLIADILPPPQYILESYLVVLQMIDEKDPANLKALIDRGAELEREYMERHSFWDKALEDGPIRSNMVQTSYAPAKSFFEIRDFQLIPAIQRGDSLAATAIVKKDLRALYEQHRKSIDQLVEMSKKRNRADEVASASLLVKRIMHLFLIGFCVLLAAVVVSFFISVSITKPIKRCIIFANDIAKGKIGRRLHLCRTDELGALAYSLDSMAGSLELREKQLQSEISLRRTLEKQLIEISEKERQAIGKDLHDGLAQQLTGILFFVANLQQDLEKIAPSEAEQISRIAKHLERSIGFTREIVQCLAPISLEKEGLSFALGVLAQELHELYKIKCKFFEEGDVLIEDSLVRINLFRIAQEAANNAAKHSRGSEIEIHLRNSGGELTLSVIDNGIGFDTTRLQDETQGLGLRFMKIRAEMTGFNLFFSSSKNGTRVDCHFKNA